MFSDVFRGSRKGALGTSGLTILAKRSILGADCIRRDDQGAGLAH